MDKSIKIENANNEKMYLCSWNDGDIVEVHTEKTLRKEYQGTNLFDKEEGTLALDSMFNWCLVIPTRANEQVRSISEIFDYFEDQENFTIGHVWEQDNMRIQRIK